MALIYGDAFTTFNRRKYFCYVPNEYTPCIPKIYTDGVMTPIRDESPGVSQAMFSTAVIVDAYFNGYHLHIPNVFDFQEIIKNIENLLEVGAGYDDANLIALIKICRKVLPIMLEEYDHLTTKLLRKNPRKYRSTVTALDYIKKRVGV